MAESDKRLVVRYMRAWNGRTIMAMEDHSPPDRPAPYADFADVTNILNWLMVLAAPALFGTLGRVPSREHILRLTDIFAAYVARGDRYTDPKLATPNEPRVAATGRLRALLSAWTPPALTGEITDAAREVLRLEGVGAPAGGWETLQNDGPDPLGDVLWWPEGIPVVMRALRAG